MKKQLHVIMVLQVWQIRLSLMILVFIKFLLLNNFSFFLVVDKDYTGPRLDGDIDVEFMKNLITTFKEQKKLHIKYAYKVIFI